MRNLTSLRQTLKKLQEKNSSFLDVLFITKTIYKILCYRTLTKGLVLGSCVSLWDPASRAPIKLELLETQSWGKHKVSC